MSSKRIIAVLGATGVQGGAVVRYLAKQGEYEIRGLTRDPSSNGVAKELSQLPNVTMVRAHFNEPATLLDAFTGAEAVYALTNFYDGENQGNPLQEAQQGIKIADAAKQAGVRFLIWSTVPSALLRSKGHFDSPRLVENKFYVSAYLKQIGLPHVDVYLGFYYENWRNFGLFSICESDGAVKIVQPTMKPETKIGMTWIERDLGPTVDAILKTYQTRPDLIGPCKEVYCVGGHHSTAEVAKEIQRQTGRETRIITAPHSGFDDLDVMYRYYNDYGLYNEFPVPTKETKDLGIKFHTLEKFVNEGVVPYINGLVGK
ncbi:hypothetical protein LTS17_001865 [Exophiala oligosperma]